MIMPSPLVIAIDGPAASGKGTLARRLAVHYGLHYLDTGKLYRAVAFWLLQSGQESVLEAIQVAKTLASDALDNPLLSSEAVGKKASTVAAIPEVRDALCDFQKKFATQLPGAVLDGRDIGSVICPQAKVKLFITASLEIRAERRFKELQKREFTAIYKDVLTDLAERDQRDSSRAVSPLVIPEGAVYIDTTTLDEAAAFHAALDSVESILNRK